MFTIRLPFFWGGGGGVKGGVARRFTGHDIIIYLKEEVGGWVVPTRGWAWISRVVNWGWSK